MQSLDVYPDVITSKAKTRTQVSLQEVEEVMSNMSAAMYWSGKPLVMNIYLDCLVSVVNKTLNRTLRVLQQISSA